jgi:6-phosphogluconolactonase (cycloisomerase 2 family)
MHSMGNATISVLGKRFLAAALLATVGLCQMPAKAEDRDERARNIVYVESNDPEGNAILAFSRNEDGKLTPLPTSPFPTGGLGITPTFNLGPFDSDQNVIVNEDKTLLFAVNGGSDSVSVFHIAADGSLRPVKGSPFPSGGGQPVSVGLAGRVLCVVNKNQDPGHQSMMLPNYTTFRVNGDGQLIPIPHSTFFVDQDASPSQALVSPLDRLVFGADFMGGLLRSFRIARSGRLIPADAQMLPAEFAQSGMPALPLGLAAHPSKRVLYVGFVTANRMGVYRYDQAGALQFVRAVDDPGKAICWLIINREGTRVYTSNTGDNSIVVYDISRDPMNPVEIQHATLRGKSSCFQIGLDSTGRFLHVVTQQAAMGEDVSANALHVLRVAGDGTLTEVPNSPTVLPVPNLVRPQGIAAL